MSFFSFYLAPVCLAGERDKISLEAEKPDSQSLIGEIDKKILKKYVPIKLIITNKSKETLVLSNKIYYIDSDKKVHSVPNSTVMFQKTKRHTVKRAVLIGIPATLSFVFMPFIIGGSIAHSISRNELLENNIKKNNFKPCHLFNNDYYSAYVFIPKKQKEITGIIIKDVSFENGETFELTSPVIEEIFD